MALLQFLAQGNIGMSFQRGREHERYCDECDNYSYSSCQWFYNYDPSFLEPTTYHQCPECVHSDDKRLADIRASFQGRGGIMQD